MKQVLSVLPRNIVNPMDASNSRFYGVQMWSDSDKKKSAGRGMITRAKYNGPLIIRCVGNFTAGNGWDYLNKQENISLTDFLDELSVNHNDVYEFETFREMIEWILTSY
jgi:hypothetical protein